MIPIPDLYDLSTYTTDRLQAELVEALISIGAIKGKIMYLPYGETEEHHAKMEGVRTSMIAARRRNGLVHQVLMLELGARRRKRNQERAAIVERCFVDIAKERLEPEIFQDLLDDAVDRTREAVENEANAL